MSHVEPERGGRGCRLCGALEGHVRGCAALAHNTMSTAVKKKNEALLAIDAMFGDTSVSKQTTLDLLEELQSEVDSKVDALKADIKHEEGGGK
jgi:hypothetical protein